MPVHSSTTPSAVASRPEAPRPYPEQVGTLGALLRGPYGKLAKLLFNSLAAKGYPEIRHAHGAFFRHILPEGSRLTDLAEMAGMTKQSMAYLVNDLESHGHVKMQPDPVDGRAKLVKLTTRGRRLVKTLLETSAEVEASMAAYVGEKDMKHLRRLLIALDEAATKLGSDR